MEKSFNDLYKEYGFFFSSKDSLYKRIVRGFYKSAKCVDNIWYVDEDEFVQLLPIDENGNRLSPLTECVQQANVSKNTIVNDIKKGKIKSAKKIGSLYYVSLAELKKLYPSQETLEKKYMKAVDYARMHNIYPNTYYTLCRTGKVRSAKQINKTWYVLKDAPLPKGYEDLPENYISSVEYAKRHNVKLVTLQKSIQQGLYKSAIKNKRNWFLDENEPCINLQRTDEVIEDSYISSVEASKLYGMDVTTINMKCRNGFYKSAKKVNGRWYVDKEEVKPPFLGLVRAEEYARKHHMSRSKVVKYVNSGKSKTGIRYCNRVYISLYEKMPQKNSKKKSKKNQKSIDKVTNK